MGGENYEAIKFQSYTAVVFEVASFFLWSWCQNRCVCVCVWLQQATYIVANTARNFSEPRRALSCNSLCRGPIVRMFMQLVVWCGVVMQLYCVVQSVRQLSAMCRMFRKKLYSI